MENSTIYQQAWVTYPPTQEELRNACRQLGTGSQVAAVLGLNIETGSRQVRRWIGGDASPSFSTWFLINMATAEKAQGRCINAQAAAV